MPMDREQKKKIKRQKKIKAKCQAAERQVRREKVEELVWLAKRAYCDGQHRQALNRALKALKLQPDETIMTRLAIHCASVLNEFSILFDLLAQSHRAGGLSAREDYYLYGTMAFSKGNPQLAAQLLQTLLDDASSQSPRLGGRFTKTKLKHAREILLACKKAMDGPGGIKADTAPAVLQEKPEVEPESAPKSAQTSAPPPQVLAAPELKPPGLKVVFKTAFEPVRDAIASHRKHDHRDLELTLKAYRISFRTSYDQLICLPTLNGVASLWHQEETARKVMKTFRGRAILADEVGLGKTIEAGLIIKEYMLRGLVRTALVLAPSSLVHQWKEELTVKFGISFVSTEDALFKEDPDRFWNEPLILASMQTAKHRRHFDAVTSRSYDMVVVDEAHCLKNRTTLNWKLVNAVQKAFLLMLTATPVQNSLEELYNLVTLLRPGHLKTQKAFKEQFVTRGDPTDPRNREKLRELLREVMVRNTRSVASLSIPPRFASTVRIAPNRVEEEFYRGISRLVIEQSGNGARFAMKKLLEAAGSSHAAALRMLEKLRDGNANPARNRIEELIGLGREIKMGGKTSRFVELLEASSEQKIVFVNYLATLEHLQEVLQQRAIPHVVFHGALGASQKSSALDAFREGRSVFLTTGSGGEGHNLQFSHFIVNYDLPWNPMQIEQRIGRVHRIGQKNAVQVYNFCSAGTIEDRILEILDKKINMFELVVGEIDMILGRLQGEEEFSDLVYEIWVKNSGEEERKKAFDDLSARLKRARSSYGKSKELDEKLFHEDFGV